MSEQKDSLLKKFGQYIANSFKLVAKYFFGKALASLVVGALFYGTMALLGIQHAGIMGFLTGIFNMVPVFGPPVAGIICAIIAVFQQPLLALYVIAASAVLQIIDQWLLTPVFVGNSVKLPPLIVLVALIAGGALWGPVGIIIAVPVAGMVRLFYDMFIKKKESPQATSGENKENNKDI